MSLDCLPVARASRHDRARNNDELCALTASPIGSDPFHPFHPRNPNNLAGKLGWSGCISQEQVASRAADPRYGMGTTRSRSTSATMSRT